MYSNQQSKGTDACALYCIVLCCVVSCRFALRCNVLSRVVLCLVVLHCVVSCRVVSCRDHLLYGVSSHHGALFRVVQLSVMSLMW